jgi:dihydrofolate reductase
MRKVYFFNMMSLDSYFEGPGHNLDWHQVDEEFNDFAIQQLQATDLIVFGRVTYTMMANYWPTPPAIETDPVVAKLMSETPKIVFSCTLHLVAWQNTRLVSSDPAEELRRLKQLPGKDIAIFGSAELAERLLTTPGVIDDLRIIVNPVLLGSGTPLFKSEPEALKLELAGLRRFGNGNVLLTYTLPG